MSEPAFTPGPWVGVTSGQNHRAVILSEDGEWHVADSTSPLSEAKANSALILEAPLLYRELEYAVQDMEDAASHLDAAYGDDTSKQLRKTIHNAKRHLAAARGETP